jgi:Spy/CpxP family protein refolding chaperone
LSVRTAITDPKPTWHHPKILLLFLSVFLCGAAAGVLGMRLAGYTSPSRVSATWQQGGREMAMDRFRKELNLTPEQAAELETVLDDFVLVYQNLQGQMDDFRAEGRKRILRILTPEQRQKFDKIMNEVSAKK